MTIPKTPGSAPNLTPTERPTAAPAGPHPKKKPSTTDTMTKVSTSGFPPTPHKKSINPGPPRPSTAPAHPKHKGKHRKLVFVNINGGPVKPIEDPSNIPSNYRTVRIELDGMRFQVSGMASMKYNKRLPRSKLLGSVLPATNVKNYVNLEHANSPEKVQWEMRGGTYTFIPMTGGQEGFNTGKIEEFERFYLNVTRAARKGQNSVVHCGEGWGRTGTMLASLKLREMIDKQLAADPTFARTQLRALETDSYAKDSIELGKYSPVPTVTGAAMVIKAIRKIRSAPISGEATEGGASVEVPGQVEALTDYYFHILGKANGQR